jgi:hypothetical protein
LECAVSQGRSRGLSWKGCANGLLCGQEVASMFRQDASTGTNWERNARGKRRCARYQHVSIAGQIHERRRLVATLAGKRYCSRRVWSSPFWQFTGLCCRSAHCWPRTALYLAPMREALPRCVMTTMLRSKMRHVKRGQVRLGAIEACSAE